MKAYLRYSLFAIFITISSSSVAQTSVAHEWIDINLEAVRKDFARPTVHARNLWHTSVAMYDAWAAYDSVATPYFLGKSLGNYNSAYDGIPEPADIQSAREEAISFAAYRMIRHRYTGSPGQVNTFFILDTMMTHLGYDPSFTSIDYSTGIPAALGNYIAQQLITAAMFDGANESGGYDNLYYEPVNEELVIDQAHFIGNPDIDSLNRWQPIGLTLFCDQGGNPFVSTPDFLSPEWGDVVPFSLADSVKSVKTRDGNDWNVYHDPGPPPKIGLEGDAETDLYRWGFDLVAKWSSHLDPDDPILWDISPASIGNIPIETFPENYEDYPDFYDRDNGGDASQGHDINPHTGMPYEPQIVPRGDYARILAEFWADGPDSETPPGHWFDIYNEISLYPEFTWRWNGQDSLDHLEYDIKTYFTLGGGMHDAAIAAWSVKGFYDYIRPVSAIRAMAELGQSTSDTLPNFHPAGLKLEPGFMELVQLGDTIFDSDTITLAGPEHVGELKMMCWLGPLVEDTCISGFAPDYQTEVAKVGWKLALDWWPYQRPTFVTPPFAGFVSGHSTYSRAAAEIMTYTTGDKYFPGGMGIFECPENNYLVFEEGPSVDVTLQWATYQDASDQCSLSRIWGGIHPPADDIPGRRMGFEIGHTANDLAEVYFNGGYPVVESITLSDDVITDADVGGSLVVSIQFDQRMDMDTDPPIQFSQDVSSTLTSPSAAWVNDTTYEVTFTIADQEVTTSSISVSISGAKNFFGTEQLLQYTIDEALYIDTDNPEASLSVNLDDPDFVLLYLDFDEAMDTGTAPLFSFPVEDPLNEAMSFNPGFSSWITETLYSAVYDLNTDVQLHDIDVDVTVATDSLGNEMVSIQEVDFFSVDNHGPAVVSITPSANTISDSEVGNETFSISISYDEEMDTSSPPTVSFPLEDPMVNTLTIDSVASTWVDESNYVLVFDVVDAEEELSDIDVASAQAKDAFGNDQSDISTADVFNIDTKNPSYISSTISSTLVNDALAGASSISMQIDFDEEMDPAIEPILSFPDESPGSSLTQSSGIWIDGDSYEASFDVVDEDLVLLNVDIQVSIASDNAGNLMETHTVADFIDIEMENPSISNFNVDNTMISDLNLGENLEIGMKFSEPIDTDVTGTPVINYPESDVSGTLIFESANWLQEDSLSLSFSLTDEDLDVEDVDIEISGLVDMVGNVMNLYLSEDALSIEMLNPNVTNVILNTDLIDNSFIGPSSFTIEAEFSEPLNQTFDPQLAFPVEDPSSTLSFDASSSTWTSETSYLFVYDVAEGLSSLADIDVEIFGGIDIAGNVSYLIVEEDEFDIDIASSLSDQNISVMNIYPNPVIAGDALKIKLGESNGVYQFRLLDALGREVIFMNSNDSEIIEIPTSGLSSGAYLLHIANEESTAAFKVQIVE